MKNNHLLFVIPRLIVDNGPYFKVSDAAPPFLEAWMHAPCEVAKFGEMFVEYADAVLWVRHLSQLNLANHDGRVGFGKESARGACQTRNIRNRGHNAWLFNDHRNKTVGAVD